MVPAAISDGKGSMRALDTPVLLDLLRGGSGTAGFLRKLGSEELATTEVNMWELGVLAHQDRSRGVERRLAALERLRQKLTVLPVDATSTTHALRLIGAKRSAVSVVSPSRAMILGALEAHGCTEWVTSRSELVGLNSSSVKMVEYAIRHTKARK